MYGSWMPGARMHLSLHARSHETENDHEEELHAEEQVHDDHFLDHLDDLQHQAWTSTLQQQAWNSTCHDAPLTSTFQLDYQDALLTS